MVEEVTSVGIESVALWRVTGGGWWEEGKDLWRGSEGNLERKGVGEGDIPIAMEIAVADVNKLLASVGAMCDAGNRVIFEKTGGRIENIKTGKSIAMIRGLGGSYTFSLWMKRGKQAAEVKPNEEVVEGGPKSVVGVFSLNTGKVVTKQVVGTRTYPMWDGEGAVKRARWIDMGTLEVLKARDF